MLRTAKKADIQAQVDRMVKRIVRRFQPERIILFGSQARGDAGPDSDVDLLVIRAGDGSGSAHAHLAAIIASFKPSERPARSERTSWPCKPGTAKDTAHSMAPDFHAPQEGFKAYL